MHLTVLVWGFTAILGRLISVGATVLVFYRVILVVAVMGGLIAKRRLGLRVPGRLLRVLVMAGAFVSVHWILFYGCVKYAGVAVAVLCLSSMTFFTALLEPVVFRRAPQIAELVMGFFVMLGVSFLVRVEAHADTTGLAMGLGSAFFSAAFGTLNGRLTHEVEAEVMTFYELSSATLVTTLFLCASPRGFVLPWALSARDVALLVALAVGCTVLPWLWSLRVLKTLSPYTLALATSLEPVYSMVLAYFLFPDAERLNARFYAGTAILIALVAANTWLKRHHTGASGSVSA
jgi:drug/metabolite transporter (DMT)-like permease